MNCAWCSPSDNGSDGICDNCMLRYFKVNPIAIHAEIEAEKKTAATSEAPQRSGRWSIVTKRRPLFYLAGGELTTNQQGGL